MYARTAEKQFAAPQGNEMDAETRSLDRCAEEFTETPATVLIWHGNPETGAYDGFDIIEAGKGSIGMVRLGVK